MNTLQTNFIEKIVIEVYVRNNQNIFHINVSNESSMKEIRITLQRSEIFCFRLKYLTYVEHKFKKALMN